MAEKIGLTGSELKEFVYEQQALSREETVKRYRNR